VESAGPGIHTGSQKFGLLLEHFQKQTHLYCKESLPMANFLNTININSEVLWTERNLNKPTYSI
jgi:hypothetical protein